MSLLPYPLPAVAAETLKILARDIFDARTNARSDRPAKGIEAFKALENYEARLRREIGVAE